jgi:hypothetical protein
VGFEEEGQSSSRVKGECLLPFSDRAHDIRESPVGRSDLAPWTGVDVEDFGLEEHADFVALWFNVLPY